MAMILVTHDLGVVAGRADDIAVMYAGRIVEKAPTRSLFADMQMPYTEALLTSIPKLGEPSHTRLDDDPRPAARPRQPAGGLQVRAALPVRAGPVPRRGAAAGRRRRPGTSTAAGSRSGRRRAGRARAQPSAGATATGVPVDGAIAPEAALMAGSGTAHLRDRRGRAAAGREPRRRVPGRAQRPQGPRRLRRQPRRPRGRDARPRRRVRLRQVDDRPGDHAAPAPDVGRGAVRRQRPHDARRARSCAGCGRACR